MKITNLYPVLFLLTFVFAGCSDDRFEGWNPVAGTGTEIRLQAMIDQINESRADDSGFADGDRIGVYAVSFGSDGNPGQLSPDGNLMTNLGFTYDAKSNSWAGARDIYFPDDKTPVDFYGYYPYLNNIEDISSYRFTVVRNQSQVPEGGKLSAYEQSDLLWAKSSAITPSTPIVSLTMKHILAGVQVTLVEGRGFDEGEWIGLEKSVIVCGTVPSGNVNFATGEVIVTTGAQAIPITAARHNDNYRAIVIPQNVISGTGLLTINVGSDSYILSKDVEMTYLPGKLHKFTVEVEKRMPEGQYVFSLINEAITAWESDPLSHEGIAREYVVVNVPEAGMIGQAISDAGLKASEIRNLKITGEINEQDFSFMREKMPDLEALNIKEVNLSRGFVEWRRTEDMVAYKYEDDCVIPYLGCAGMKYLSYVVLPDNVKCIGSMAFLGTSISGSLSLPEGLEFIGEAAFQSRGESWDYTWSYDFPGGRPKVSNNLTGKLELPTTLKHIGNYAFENCDFTGDLILPEGLEYIGEYAFANCEYITGELHIPSSIKFIDRGAFKNMRGIRGSLEIPGQFTIVESYGYLPVVSVQLPDAPLTIADEAFYKYPLRGDMVIPETVTYIGRAAFAETELSHIIFPQNLEFLVEAICCNMINLQDTVKIPPLIKTVGDRAFANCPKLEAVIIPERVERIMGNAFADCFSLNYIRCDAKTPPEVDGSAFNGVAKDNFTVEVPEESVDAYRNAPVWSEFRRIAAYRNFVARPSKYNVLNKGGKKEIILNADDDWELAECPSWCHVDKQSGNKKSTLNLTVDPLTHGAAPRSGVVTFRLKGDHEYMTHINVGQYDYEYEEDSYIQLHKATKGNGIDLFFVGDGYDAVDISSGIYMKDMEQEMEYLFAVEPYTTYKDYFNVYTSFALSEDSGTEDVNHWRTTKFHGAVWNNSNVRLKVDWEAAMDYCATTVPPIASRPDPKVGVILVMNTEMYEGVTYSLGDSFCAVVTKSSYEYPSDARGLVQHEAGGHGIGWLGDEYIYHMDFIQKCPCQCCEHVASLLELQSQGFALNMSLNGKYRDVPWNHLIYKPEYSDIVDIYEGGYFHSRGVYRSERNSCMNNNVPYFSTWSRQLIVQRIMKLAGEEFRLDSFYALDKRGMGRDFTSTSRGDEMIPSHVLHGQPPVIIRDYKFGKKGGKK